MQTKINVSATLNAEEGTRAESEEKDTSEGAVSFSQGNVKSTFKVHQQNNSLKTTKTGPKGLSGVNVNHFWDIILIQFFLGYILLFYSK